MKYEPGGSWIPDPDRRYWRRRANRRVRKARIARTLLRWSGVAALNVAILSLLVFSGSRALRHLSTSPQFELRAIEVEGARPGAEDGIRSRLADLEGRNLLEVDLRDVAARVRREPWVLDCAVRRLLPSTLRVRVSERRPGALVRVGGQDLLVDVTGAPLGPPPPDLPPGTPVLTGLDAVRPAARQGAVRRAAAALERLRRAAAPFAGTIAEIDLSHEDRLEVATLQAGPRLLLDVVRSERNLTAYFALQSEIERRVGPLEYVDLRWRGRIAVMPRPSEPEGDQDTSQSEEKS